MKRLLGLAATTALMLTGLGTAVHARDQIQVVGSSTVFPFSASVAERFGKSTDFKEPVVEATGSGGGLKLFCAGVGEEHPDITNSSRKIKQSEIDKCTSNGVTEITEVMVGFDGIVIANSAEEGEDYDLSLKHVFLALAKQVPDAEGNLIDNPYTKWSEIDSSLPNKEIEVLGPPPTSGTRDAFVELALEGGCKQFESINALKKTNKELFKGICHTMREDGHWIDAGENDVLIVNKLVANSDALGVFGFSFLDQNEDIVKPSTIDGVEPEFELIASGEYPVSRGLFFYVKNAHVGTIPGIVDYVTEFVSEEASGEDGYLVDKGLIPLEEEAHAEMADNAINLVPMSN